MKILPILAFIAAAGSISNGVAADHAMTGAELTALLSKGKVITMGGPGQGMTGQLTVNADGTASGSGKTDSGVTFTIEGTWAIEKNAFCRTWKGGRDSGKKICETWVLTSPNVARIMVKNKQIGQNSW